MRIDGRRVEGIYFPSRRLLVVDVRLDPADCPKRRSPLEIATCHCGGCHLLLGFSDTGRLSLAAGVVADPAQIVVDDEYGKKHRISSGDVLRQRMETEGYELEEQGDVTTLIYVDGEYAGKFADIECRFVEHLSPEQLAERDEEIRAIVKRLPEMRAAARQATSEDLKLYRFRETPGRRPGISKATDFGQVSQLYRNLERRQSGQ